MSSNMRAGWRALDRGAVVAECGGASGAPRLSAREGHGTVYIGILWVPGTGQCLLGQIATRLGVAPTLFVAAGGAVGSLLAAKRCRYAFRISAVLTTASAICTMRLFCLIAVSRSSA